MDSKSFPRLSLTVSLYKLNNIHTDVVLMALMRLSPLCPLLPSHGMMMYSMRVSMYVCVERRQRAEQEGEKKGGGEGLTGWKYMVTNDLGKK